MDRNERCQDASHVLQVLSHPVRLRILDGLRTGEACVCHLESFLDRPQPYVSQQLGILREAGMVVDRRDGPFVYYSLCNPELEQLLHTILGPPPERGTLDTCGCPECDLPGAGQDD